MNKTPIRVSGTTELNKALVGTEYGNRRDKERVDTIVTNVHRLVSLEHAVHSIRSIGSAALNLCCVADGSLCAYYEWGLHCWDMCAGAVIVAEAGGRVFDPKVERPFDIMAQRILATSTEQLAHAISAVVDEVPTERD